MYPIMSPQNNFCIKFTLQKIGETHLKMAILDNNNHCLQKKTQLLVFRFTSGNFQAVNIKWMYSSIPTMS